MDLPAVVGSLEAALGRLIRCHRYLLDVDINERTLTHHLANGLAELLPEWDVDCEYNRLGSTPKRLSDFMSDELNSDRVDDAVADPEARTVFPDIIVHRRGPEGPHVLVIEVKKSSSRVSDRIDRGKIHGYLHADDLQYTFGAFVKVGVGERVGEYEFEVVARDGSVTSRSHKDP